LGNQLLIIPLIQEISETFPNCKIDLFVKGNLGPVLFKNFEKIGKIIRLPRNHFKHVIQYILAWLQIKQEHYDIVVNVVRNSSSGRLATKFANSRFKFYGAAEKDFQLTYSDYKHIAKYPVYDFRNYLSRLGIPSAYNDIPLLDIKLNPVEIREGKRILQTLVGNEEKIISLFTYATGKKCYTEAWWLGFYNKLKSYYPSFKIIEVLPVENISNISSKEPTFYSKDIRVIGAVIANTSVFIGADSGMMHLASAVKTPTIGLFSITNPKVYAPYNNNSCGINTTGLALHEILKEIDRIILTGNPHASMKNNSSNPQHQEYLNGVRGRTIG
jgi:ADP-heptose:LPS heptosyltransferase